MGIKKRDLLMIDVAEKVLEFLFGARSGRFVLINGSSLKILEYFRQEKTFSKLALVKKKVDCST